MQVTSRGAPIPNDFIRILKYFSWKRVHGQNKCQIWWHEDILKHISSLNTTPICGSSGSKQIQINRLGSSRSTTGYSEKKQTLVSWSADEYVV